MPVTSRFGLVAVEGGCWRSGPGRGGAFVFGIGVPWLIIAFATAWQRRAPDAMIGRIGAAADTFTVGPQSGSIAVGAGLVELLDYRILLFGAAAVIVACAVALAVRTTSESSPSPGGWSYAGLAVAFSIGA